MALMWEAYHLTLQDDITIQSRFFKTVGEAYDFATKQIEMLPDGVPVAVREIDADLRVLNPIAQASEDIVIFRKSTKEDSNAD